MEELMGLCKGLEVIFLILFFLKLGLFTVAYVLIFGGRACVRDG